MTGFSKEFLDVQRQMDERFGEGIPTMLIDESLWGEAVAVAKHCLATGQNTLLEHFGLDKLTPDIEYA